MTEIKFYHNAPDRLAAACTITTKAVQRGMKVVVYAPDDAVARKYDALLWSQPTTAFVPHVSANSPLADRTPVIITRDLNLVAGEDVLLNLDSALPPDFDRFKMLVEIVPRDDEERARARQRWQFYKERGYPIVAHDLAHMGST